MLIYIKIVNEGNIDYWIRRKSIFFMNFFIEICLEFECLLIGICLGNIFFLYYNYYFKLFEKIMIVIVKWKILNLKFNSNLK